MSAGALSRRYARALFELAEERGTVEPVGRELADMAAAWRDSRELRDTFENPAITAQMRRQVLDALVSRMGLSPLVRNTVLLLSDRRRLRALPDVEESYRDLAEQRAGRIRAEVVTAAPMPDSYFSELQRALESVTGKKVVVEKQVDPSLIAGVVTRVGDRVFDGSLKNRLDELKDQLLQR